MSSTSTAAATAQARMREIQEELPSARATEAEAKKALVKAQETFVKATDKGPRSAAFKTADSARADHDASVKDLADLRSEESTYLAVFAQRGNAGSRGNGARSGDFAGESIYARAASELSLVDGVLRVDGQADSFLAQPYAAGAGFTVSPGSGLTAPASPQPFVPLAADRRFLYPAFQRMPLDPGDLAIVDYKQTGSRTVTGSVERDPVSTSEKAQQGVEVTLETPPLREFAIVQDGIPVKLLEAEESLRAWLEAEMSYQISLAVDLHTVAQIEAAMPAEGSEGDTIIEQVRYAVKAMRAKGARPSVLALPPDIAAGLDVMKTGKEGLEQYVFVDGDTPVGSVPSLFGCEILESPALTVPWVIDPNVLGVLYTAQGTLLIDPYTGLSTNVVRLRSEAGGLLHVRDASGCYIIKGA